MLTGIVFHYPDQKVTDGVPIAYPWTIYMQGEKITVTNVCLDNPYQGIKAYLAPQHFISNVTGSPFLTGIYIDCIHDIGRIENVHFKNSREGGPASWVWGARNARGFVIGVADWEKMINCFCWGYGIGYHFVEGETEIAGRTITTSGNGTFDAIGADRAHTPVVIDSCKPQGLAFTNCEFVADPLGQISGRAAAQMGVDARGHIVDGESNPSHVVVGEKNRGMIRFVNCSFWGSTNNIARIDGEGRVSFNSCAFRQWGGEDRSRPAFLHNGGTLQVTDSQFAWFAPQAEIGAKAQGTILANNVHSGPWTVKAPSNARLVMQGNLETDAPAPGSNPPVSATTATEGD